VGNAWAMMMPVGYIQGRNSQADFVGFGESFHLLVVVLLLICSSSLLCFGSLGFSKARVQTLHYFHRFLPLWKPTPDIHPPIPEKGTLCST